VKLHTAVLTKDPSFCIPGRKERKPLQHHSEQRPSAPSQHSAYLGVGGGVLSGISI